MYSSLKPYDDPMVNSYSGKTKCGDAYGVIIGVQPMFSESLYFAYVQFAVLPIHLFTLQRGRH